jgi:Trypsin-co-occurring domain 2
MEARQQFGSYIDEDLRKRYSDRAKPGLSTTERDTMFASRDIFAVSLAALLISQPAGAVGPEAAGSPDVELLLRQIRSTLIRVQGEIAERRLPELKDILITLQTGIKTAGGGKISFFVVSLGDTVSNERVQTLRLL